jgi:hypothetical protein
VQIGDLKFIDETEHKQQKQRILKELQTGSGRDSQHQPGKLSAGATGWSLLNNG